MFLKYSDTSWQWLRLTDSYSRLLVLSDISTRYVFSHVQQDATGNREKVSIRVVSYPADSSDVLDSIRLLYSGKTSDTAVLRDKMAMYMEKPVRDSLIPVEVVSVRFSSPYADAVLSSDRIVTKFTLLVRDALSLNEAFFFGGVFNVDVNNIVFTSDKLVTKQETDSSDVATVDEFVRVGLRHMIDFYLGGFTLGSVVFGGRLR